MRTHADVNVVSMFPVVFRAIHTGSAEVHRFTDMNLTH